MDELINKLFRKNTDNIFLQMFRYLFVGTASFLIDFIIYLSLINFLGQNYLISAAIAFFISVLIICLLPGFLIKQTETIKF